MILNKNSIKKYIENSEDDCFQPASYDVRLDMKEGTRYKLEPGHSVLVSTIERIKLDNHTAIDIKDKSSLARIGIKVTQGFVDPGFRGNLTLYITNDGDSNYVLRGGQRIAQLKFEQTEPTEGYDGHYQDSQGVVTSRVKL